jgi:hypothetical protein
MLLGIARAKSSDNDGMTTSKVAKLDDEPSSEINKGIRKSALNL